VRCDVSTDSGRNERDGPPRTRWTPTTTTRNQKVPPPDVQRPDRPIDQSLRHRVGISHWLAGSTPQTSWPSRLPGPPRRAQRPLHDYRMGSGHRLKARYGQPLSLPAASSSRHRRHGLHHRSLAPAPVTAGSPSPPPRTLSRQSSETCSPKPAASHQSPRRWWGSTSSISGRLWRPVDSAVQRCSRASMCR